MKKKCSFFRYYFSENFFFGIPYWIFREFCNWLYISIEFKKKDLEFLIDILNINKMLNYVKGEIKKEI